MNEDFGRAPINDQLKADIAKALNSIPPGKRGALILVADTDKQAQAHLAANLGDHWKVAAGVNFDLNHLSSKPTGQVVVIGSW